ncbi:ribonuclease J [Bacillus sp. FJAT-47783]|uniref:ribonuclease J n=1 Tax=Bacillus sp. FJAT-47783 TaxID=2922712 RepID=UPI001FAB62D3|nr:ribonuclease J [Bacillus sp. FJAT-47783]
MKKTEKIKLIALGGVGEIGKNMYVVEVDSDLFVVDAGLMYPENEMLGIDVVIPDITYLKENKDRVKAVFLTHGHDEHIGGIFHVIQQLNVPIYGTKLTLALAKERLKPYGLHEKANLREVTESTKLSFQSVTVSFFRTYHSIPDSVGICFHTSMGAIVHTGDFKFDQTPVGQQFIDIGRMANIGNEGVLCLLSDSMNAEIPGYTGSEAVVGEEIKSVVHNAKGRVIVSLFASNIHRIQQVIDAAENSNRKLAVVGKNIVNIIQTAVKLGYLSVSEDLMIPVQNVSKYPKNNVIIMTTSHKGEPLSVLTKMARGTHKQYNIEKGDTVLVASTPIQGHELTFSKTIDMLFRAGANVVTKNSHIHISGHGYQEELKLMLNLMKPKYFIPIHGDFKRQKAHAKLAASVGVPEKNIFLVNKGEVIEFQNGAVKTSQKVPSGNVLIDGLGVGDVGNIVLRDRRLLSQDGILVVVVTLSKSNKRIVAGPEIITRGFVYVRESEQLIAQAVEIVQTILTKCMEEQTIEWSSIKQNIRDVLNQFLFEQTKRRPMILPIIMEV